MVLICFDPHAGTLRRYFRGVKNAITPRPICLGFAKIVPWESLPLDQRVVEAGVIEAFRQAKPSSTVPEAVA